MYIGKLNEKYSQIKHDVYIGNTKQIPEMKIVGNPFLGEELFVHHEQLLENGMDIHVSLSEKFLINEVVLYLSEKCNATSVKMYTANKEMEISCHMAETGETIAKKVVKLPVEMQIDEFVIEVNGEFFDAVIKNIEIYGSDLSGEILYPTPVAYKKISDTRVSISTFDSYAIDDEMCESAGRILEEKFEEITGVGLVRGEDGKIRLLRDGSVKENGYNLSVTPGEVLIAASDVRGLVYGVEVLLKLIDKDSIPQCEIEDYPRMKMRGIHIPIPHPSQFDFAKRMVKYILSPMGYNFIFMEVGGGMELESHPEINEAVVNACRKADEGIWPPFPHSEAGCGATVKKSQLREFIAYCREFGIDVIPEIQSLSHVQFMTIAHPEIAERAENTEKEDFYAHSSCPSNPKTYELLFDFIDEVVDVFEPREYVHMGHDEVYEIGICPKCKGKEPADLFADDICRIHDYLAKKGLKMFVWGDMLQTSKKHKVSEALDKIPKDIVIISAAWYYNLNNEVEDEFLAKGFRVLMGNMYSSHFPRYESRIIKDGVMGAEMSFWIPVNERSVATEGKFYELLYLAQMLWSPAYVGYNRYSYDRILKAWMPEIREKMQDVKYPSHMPNKSEVVLVDHGDYSPNNAIYESMFPINHEVESLIFEHATSKKLVRLVYHDLDTIGHYKVTYEDESSVFIPLVYTENISWWNRYQNEPFKPKYYRHFGYQEVSYLTDGIENYIPGYGPKTIYRYEWINPKPKVKIKVIEYIPEHGVDTKVYVSRILGIE